MTQFIMKQERVQSCQQSQMFERTADIQSFEPLIYLQRDMQALKIETAENDKQKEEWLKPNKWTFVFHEPVVFSLFCDHKEPVALTGLRVRASRVYSLFNQKLQVGTADDEQPEPD